MLKAGEVSTIPYPELVRRELSAHDVVNYTDDTVNRQWMPELRHGTAVICAPGNPHRTVRCRCSSLVSEFCNLYV